MSGSQSPKAVPFRHSPPEPDQSTLTISRLLFFCGIGALIWWGLLSLLGVL